MTNDQTRPQWPDSTRADWKTYADALEAQLEQAQKGESIPRPTDTKPSDAMPQAGHNDWREQAEWWERTCGHWRGQAEQAQQLARDNADELVHCELRAVKHSEALEQAQKERDRAQLMALPSNEWIRRLGHWKRRAERAEEQL